MHVAGTEALQVAADLAGDIILHTLPGFSGLYWATRSVAVHLAAMQSSTRYFST